MTTLEMKTKLLTALVSNKQTSRAAAAKAVKAFEAKGGTVKKVAAGVTAKKSKKLPVPGPKPAQVAASAVSVSDKKLQAKIDAVNEATRDKGVIADPKKDGIPVTLQVQNRKPLTPEQQAVVDEIARKRAAIKAEKEQAKLAVLAKIKEAKAAKAAISREKSKVKREKIEADLRGETRKAPLEGKAAAAAIKQAAKSAKKAAKADAAPRKDGKPTADAKTQPERRAAVKAMLANRKVRETPTGKITMLAKKNPKRDKAAKRFAIYKNGMTTAAYIEAVAKIASESLGRADIRWDIAHGFISVK